MMSDPLEDDKFDAAAEARWERRRSAMRITAWVVIVALVLAGGGATLMALLTHGS